MYAAKVEAHKVRWYIKNNAHQWETFYYEFTWFFPVDETRTYLVSTLMISFRLASYISVAIKQTLF